MIPSYGFGLRARPSAGSGRTWPTVLLSAISCTPGIAFTSVRHELLRRHLQPREEHRVDAFGLPLLDEALQLRRGRGRVGAGDREDRGGAELHTHVLQARHEHRASPTAAVVASPSTATFLPSSVLLLLQQLERDRDPSLLHRVERRSSSRRGAESMISCVSWKRDQDRLVLLRDARLRLAGEVDEVAEHREHVVVLGERRAQRERGRGHDRAERLVDGHDLAAGDAAVRVDVVDERLVDLVLVDARASGCTARCT